MPQCSCSCCAGHHHDHDHHAAKQEGLLSPRTRLVLAGICALLAEACELLHQWQPAALALHAADAGYTIPPYLAPALALAAIALTGLGVFRDGVLALFRGRLGINALMSVAVAGAMLLGDFAEAATVMVLFTISESIEERALTHARKAIASLMAIAPDMACVRTPEGQWQRRPVAEVAQGDTVRVEPGERIPLDGCVSEGSTSVNQAAITGESMPVPKTVGDMVHAGTLNTDGAFQFMVTACAGQTTLARIIHAVEQAQASKAPIQRFVDVFARYYTPAIFALALALALLPPLVMGAAWAASIHNALVILVIGCPCALVIATPVTLVSGMAAATRQGMLIKGGMFVEQGRKLDVIALDKTGTLTCGRPVQTDFIATGLVPDEQAAQIAASLAARSSHPVACALTAHADAQGTARLEVDGFAARPGLGMEGSLNGQRWFLGSRALVDGICAIPASIGQQVQALQGQGKSVSLLASDAGVAAVFAVADSLREGAAEAIASLKRLGLRTVMLTGDNAAAAGSIAKAAGVDEVHADLLPQDKLRLVQELEEQGLCVGMVGDGVNDAPALARARVGMAMGACGSDTALETADVALMDDDVRKLPRFIALCRGTFAIVVQNIVLALGIKAVVFGLACAGLASMWMAVFADVGATLLVVLNALRAMRQKQ